MSRLVLPETILVGLTGSIGAGKSVVAEVWKGLGAGIVEGDEMGRLALSTDEDLRLKLSERFGNEILDTTGQILHTKLAEAAFNSPGDVQDLTELTFPTLYRLAREEFRKLAHLYRVVVFDAALIFKWGVEDDFDVIVAVTSPDLLLIERASARLGIDPEQAASRLAGQLSSMEKARRTDLVINNNSSLTELKRKAVEVWDRLTSWKKAQQS